MPSEAELPAAHDSFDDLLREVALAPAVRPAALVAEVARADLTGRLVGHFRVIERLGAGGMGVVYRAEDTRLGRSVALKVLARSASGPQGLDLLMREARAAAAINHAHVAAVYEVGEACGTAFIAMEYVDGVTLRSRVGRGPMPIDEVVRYAVQIAWGLAKAHARGVVHRDLKPDNVMIDRDDRIKVLDFGLARPARDDVSEPRGARAVVAGTPAYMAPEQADGGRVDARTDVFSFGVVLYEMLTGHVPFPGRGHDVARWTFVPEVAAAIRRPETPPELAEIVAGCLHELPAERFRDGGSLARALERVRAGRKVGVTRAHAWIAVGVASAIGATLAVATARRPSLVSAPSSPSVVVAGVPHTLSRLTANVPDDPILSAALSPDGASLAYVDATGLAVERIGAAAERLTPGVTGQPQIVAWFPDGDRLALCTALPGSEQDEELWVISRSGKTRPKLVARGPFTALSVAPGGDRIAFAANDSVGWLAAGGESPAVLHRLVTKTDGCFINDVAWSPDGARLAYPSLCFDSLARTAIETVAVASGGAPSVVVADPHLYNSFVRAGVVWTGGGEIVYPRAEWLPAEAGSNLYAVAVDPSGAPTSVPRRVTSWVGVGAAALSASARTGRIAFIRFEAQTDVYVGALSDGGRTLSRPERLTMTDRNDRPSAWSRDGRSVYFFSDRSGNFDVYSQSIAGGTAVPVASDAQWETLSQVTPDGASLLYWRFPSPGDRADGVRPELVRRALASGNGEASRVYLASALSHPAGAGRPAPWEVRVRCPEKAGASCVLSEKDGDGHLVFYALDPVAGRGEALFRIDHPTAASNIWDVSPDGALLAIPRAGGPVEIQPLRGDGPVKTVGVEGCDPITPAWSADGSGLFVSVDCEADAPPFRLYYVGLDGRTSLLWQAPPLYILESEPSPDGEHLAIAVKQKDDDVWMVDDVPLAK